MLDERIKKIYSYLGWRQKIKLENNMYTPGNIDYDIWTYLGLPKSIKGKTFIDIGANDGQVVFEAEKRGAKEVCASDLYINSLESMRFGWPIKGIELLKEFFNSNITIQKEGIYELSNLNKKFDIVLINNVINWIKDLDSAIKNVSMVSSDMLYIADGFLKSDNSEYVENVYHNMYNVSYLESVLNRNDFDVIEIKKLSYDKLVMARYLDRPRIKSNGIINFYNIPEESANVVLRSELDIISTFKFKGYYFIQNKGWIKEEDVILEYFSPSFFYKFLYFFGLEYFYFLITNIKNKKNEIALLVIAKKRKNKL